MVAILAFSLTPTVPFTPIPPNSYHSKTTPPTAPPPPQHQPLQVVWWGRPWLVVLAGSSIHRCLPVVHKHGRPFGIHSRHWPDGSVKLSNGGINISARTVVRVTRRRRRQLACLLPAPERGHVDGGATDTPLREGCGTPSGSSDSPKCLWDIVPYRAEFPRTRSLIFGMSICGMV